MKVKKINHLLVTTKEGRHKELVHILYFIKEGLDG